MRKKVSDLEHEIINLKADHEKEYKAQLKKITELHKVIHDTKKTVIQPLMMEIKVKDELIRRLKSENDLNLKNLK